MKYPKSEGRKIERESGTEGERKREKGGRERERERERECDDNKEVKGK